MIYFSKGYIEFLDQLNHNNNTHWFRENKKWYELTVREPFKKLLMDLLPKVNKMDPEIKMQAKEALFRISRDMRFSKHQYPYKTHMAAGFSKGGRKSKFAGYYLQIGRSVTAIGGGLPYLDREALRKIRIEIGYNQNKFNEIIQDPVFTGLYGSLLGEIDGELPNSFSDISASNPIISRKQIYYTAFYRTENIIFRKDLIPFIMNHYQAGYQLNSFLIHAVSNFKKSIYQS